ncbi:MAG: PKD domain-containing protein [Bacteroidales bacterium]
MLRSLHLKFRHSILLCMAFVFLFMLAPPNLQAQTNNALAFDGSDDYVNCGTINPTSFTVEAWVYLNTVNKDQAVISTLSETAGTGFELHIGSNNIPVVTLRNGSTWVDTKGTEPVSVGKWYHMALTYNGSTCKIYVNGHLTASSTITSYNSGSNTLCIGRRSSGSYLFNGRIDEVRIWNTIRSQADIINSRSTSFTNPASISGLMAYYEFNQGTAAGDNTSITILADSSATSTNGTLTNFTLSTGNTNSNFVDGFNTSDLVCSIIPSSSTVNLDSTARSKNIIINSNTSWAVGASESWITLDQTSGIGNDTLIFTVSHNTSGTTRNAIIVLEGTNAENDTIKVDQSGYLNNSLSFDGINDYVAIPAIGDNYNQLTIETWIKLSSITAWNGIYNASTWNDSNLYFQLRNGNIIEFTVCGNSSTTDASYSFSTGKWYHIAASYNQTTKQISIYVNGALIKTETYSTALIVNLSAAEIGALTTSRHFPGQMDNYSIWSTARTQTEIISDMHSELDGTESGLLAYFNFNQGSADETNTGIDTLDNAVAGGVVGTLTNLSLTGTSSNWVEGYNTNNVTYSLATSSKKIEIERASGSTAKFVITSNTDWSIYSPNTWYNLDKETGIGNDTITITTTETNTLDTTRSIELIISGTSTENDTVTVTQLRGNIAVSSNTVTLGAATGCSNSFIITSNIDWSINESTDWFSLSQTSGTGNVTITITADQTNTLNESRSAILVISGTNAENDTVTVTQNMATIKLSRTAININSKAGSKGNFSVITDVDWKATCSASWLSVSSLSGTGRDTLTITAQALPEGVTSRYANIVFSGLFDPAAVIVTQTVQPNNALAFDGNNDYINVDTLSSSIDFSQGFSYAGWIKWNSFSTWSRLFDFGNGPGSDNILIANSSTNNNLTFDIYKSGASSSLTTTNILSTGTWTYIAATLSNTGAAKIYVNGNLITSGTINIPNTIARNINYIGKSNWTADSYFNGSMDEISIWNKELSQAEITSGMNNGFTGEESNLLAYYSFDQGVANATNTGIDTLYDVTTKQQDATLTNFALSGNNSNWVDGCTGKLLYADASSTNFNYEAGTTDLTITSSVNWTVSSSASWLTVDASSGTGSDTLTINYETNITSHEERTAIVTVAGPDVDTIRITFTQANGITITPDFSASTTKGLVPLSIDFSNNSTATNTTITTWAWDFGDGETSNLETPSHIYNNIGTYSITLIASNGTDSDTLVKNDYIDVSRDISMNNGNVTVYDSLYFYDSGGATGQYACKEDYTLTFYPSTPGAVLKMEFESFASERTWDYLEIYNNINASGELMATQTGTNFTTSLQATNANGALCTIFHSDFSNVYDGWKALVSEVLPYADFLISDTLAINYSTVTFSDASIMTGLNSWTWDFGDGNSSTQQNPSHIYATAGIFTVTLTASNGTVNQSISKTIHIVDSITASFAADKTSGYQPTIQFTNASAGATSYEWNFGDGSAVTNEVNPSHTFYTAGTFTVTLTATDGSSNSNETSMNIVASDIVANFSSDVTFGYIPTVQFTDATVGATSWSWNFGDGNTSTEQNPSHTYTTVGNYTVSLAVSDGYNTDTLTVDNYITAMNITADFNADITSGYQPTVQFTDATVGATSWSWNFGDGSDISTEQNPSHTYTNTGSYDVTLIVSDGVNSDTLTRANYITAKLSDVNFNANVTTGYLPTITFTDASIGNISLWSWDFGDGTTSTEQNPTHSYTTLGTYTVSLVVSDGTNSDTLVKTNYIETNVLLMSNQTVTLTNDTSIKFFDSGNSTENYQNSEDYTLVIYPSNLHSAVKINFNSYELELGRDNLYIYDGTSTSDKLISTLSGLGSNGSITATSKSGALCIRFYSDESIVNFGWNALITEVEKNLILNWNSPAIATYGTTVGNEIMNATANVDGTFAYSFRSDSVFNAGTHSITATFTPTDIINYSAATKTVNYTVNKTNLTVIADDLILQTGSTIPELTFTYSGFVNGDNVSDLDLAPVAATRATSSSDAGEYPITVLAGLDNNYEMTYSEGTLTLTTLQVPSLTWANPNDIVYGTTLNTTQLNASTSVDGTFSYSPAAGLVLNAGNAQALSVTFTPTDRAIYASVSKTVTINVAKASLTATANNQSKIYGSANPNLTITYNGFANGDDASVLDLAPVITTSASTVSNVGNYDIAISAGLDNNYNITSVAGTLSVTVRTLTLSNFTADSKIYDGTATVTGVGFTDDRISGDELTFSYDAAFENKNIGTGKNVNYTNITISGGSDKDNYSLASSTSTTSANITAKELTVGGIVAANKVYDGTAVATLSGATINGLIDGDEAALANATSGTFAQTTVGASVAVTTNINLSGNDAGNYALVQPLGVTANITPASLTVTANSITKTKGQAYTFTGAEFSTSAMFGSDAVNSVTLTSDGALSSAAEGEYPIVASNASGLGLGNYSITYVDGKLTVTAKQLPVITWSTPAGIVYGTALSSDQLNATADIPGTFAYSPSIGSVLNAGSSQVLSVTFTPNDQDAYAEVTQSTTINVNKALLTVTADNQSIMVGSSIPQLTFQYDGFVNGDDGNGLDVRPTATTAATEESPVGEYPITVSGGSDSNYQFSYVEGTLYIIENPSLTVSTAELTIGAAANSTVDFTIASNVTWTISSAESWLSISSTSGTGDATITLFAEANPNTAERTAAVTVAGDGVESKTILVTQSAAVGIDDNTLSAVKVYPNPASDLINVHLPDGLENVTVELLSINGVKLSVIETSGNLTPINVSALAKGIYILRITSANSNTIVRWIKE